MNKFTTAALVLGAVSATSFAQTREFDPTPSGIGFRIGIAIPSDSALRDIDDTWTSLGVDYNIENSILRTGNSFISLDYFSKNLSGTGGQVWNLMLGNRFFPNTTAGGYNLYFLAGLGTVVLDGDDREFKFGGIIGAGLELGPALFMEGRYSVSEKVDGINPGMLGIYLGYRF